jgi:hypothetical protein
MSDFDEGRIIGMRKGGNCPSLESELDNNSEMVVQVVGGTGS